MKINSDAARQAQELYRQHNDQPQAVHKTTANTEPTATQKPDRAEISATSRLKAKALDAVHAAPETRADLVKSLHTQVQAGTYTVDDQKLADHITHHLNIGA